MKRNENHYNWSLLKGFPDGHRYFTCTERPRIAVCDQSGPIPDLTDDGVLWLDRSRSLRWRGGSLWVPVVDEHGGRYRTSAWGEEAAWLLQVFGQKPDIANTLASALTGLLEAAAPYEDAAHDGCDACTPPERLPFAVARRALTEYHAVSNTETKE